MYCSKWGVRLSDTNQNYCHNCEIEIITHPKTANFKTETPQNEPPPKINYIPVKQPI